MDGLDSPTLSDPTRRRVLMALATAGVAGPFALQVLAQAGPLVSIDALRQASAILGDEFSPERLAVIEKALQRNLDQFQLVRDLVIDDLVEPGPTFLARTHGGPLSAPGKAK